MKKLLTMFLMLLPVCLPAQTREVTLQECIDLAVQNDPYLKNSGLDVLAAQARKAEALWEYFPSVKLSILGYRAINPMVHLTPKDILGNGDAANELNEAISTYCYENGIKPYFETMGWGYTFSAMATQPIYAGGRIVNGNRLAALGLEAAQLQKNILGTATRDTVECKYWRIVALQEKMNTLHRAGHLLDTLYKDVNSALQAGLATDNDLMQVTIRQKELRSSEIRLKNGIRLAKMELFNSIGMKYTYLGIDSLKIADSLGELPVPADVLLRDEEISRSDESLLLEMQVEAGKLRKKMAVGEYLPQAGVGVGYGYGNLMGTGKARTNGLAFASVQIPITDLGKAAQRSKRYEYEVQKAVGEKEYLDAQLTLLMHKVRLDMESAWEQMEVARETVSLAENTLEHERANYNAGYATLAQVLQCELTLQNALESCIDRSIEYKNAVTAYLHRCGR